MGGPCTVRFQCPGGRTGGGLHNEVSCLGRGVGSMQGETPCLGGGDPCMVRSNASWVMVTCVGDGNNIAVCIFTAHKLSLGQGNIFRAMCQEFCPQQGGSTWPGTPRGPGTPPSRPGTPPLRYPPGPGTPGPCTPPWDQVHPPDQVQPPGPDTSPPTQTRLNCRFKGTAVLIESNVLSPEAYLYQ